MIDLIFYYKTECVFIRITGNNVGFANSLSGGHYGSIDNLKLNYSNVCREFPDLELRKDWREEAIRRWKEKIKELNDEEKIAEEIINDLRKHDYIPKFKQKAGFRKEPIK